MPTASISYKDTGFFSDLMCNYLDQKKELSSFYNYFPKLENFQEQLKEKQSHFFSKNRQQLVTSLQDQYMATDASEKTKWNIEQLANENTFTITTGHQLNLFTGPLYFLYKIISTINLTEELKEAYPNFNFVPIYWMATEDHDFLEINYFSLKGEKIAWNKPEGLENKYGAVGEFSTKGLEQVFTALEESLGLGNNAKYLKELFHKGYLENDNLTDATRYIVNELFGEYGLVIVDGNDKGLKSLFVPVIEQELQENTAFAEVTKTTAALEKLNHKGQVTPREINLFYLANNLRERIIHNEDGSYTVLNHNKHWKNYNEIQAEVKEYPERFSPNVILRPVYQEVILPNLCYIGGGGELAYWFQLKESFKAFTVPFPILLLRNSVLLISKKQYQKLEKLSVTNQELFMKQFELINHKVRQISDISIDFSAQKEALKIQFNNLESLAVKTDESFSNAVKAQKAKQIKGLNMLEKRLLKAQRLKLNDQVRRLKDLHSQLFPQNNLQERKMNFSEFYLEYGENLILSLKDQLRPLEHQFNIVQL